ncbi:uncharacterized protein [Penaeus vannamei]|uniref:uncharacterized protein n=1 Tax=Penaeus vannamei TaxID=6689 RepID=UPI00387FA33B
MRLSPSSNSPINSNSPGSPTPGSPLTTTQNTATTTHPSIPAKSLSISDSIVPLSLQLRLKPKLLSNLTDLSGNPISAEPHLTPNTCTGTVSPANCPIDTKYWSDCGEDILACLNLMPLMYPTCSAQSRTCANYGSPHNVFYRGCTTYKFEFKVTTLKYKLGLTLREPDRKHVDEVSLILPTLVTSDIHPPPTLIPPIPLPLTPSQHNLSPSTRSTSDIHPPDIHPPSITLTPFLPIPLPTQPFPLNSNYCRCPSSRYPSSSYSYSPTPLPHTPCE